MSTVLWRLPLWESAPVSSPRPSFLKPPITGLIPRQVSQVGARAGDLGGVVADCYWSLLQPNEGGEIDQTGTAKGSWKEIADALATGLPVRLRIKCGVHSPEWAMDLGGERLTIINPSDPAETHEVPRWWKPEYLAAWGDFMGKMAALLDLNPQIREVASHPATTIFAEPFQRGTKNVAAATGPNAGKTNVQVYHEAGLTGVQLDNKGKIIAPDPLDTAAILWPTQLEANGSPRWRNLGWQQTRYYLPFNPLQSWKVTSTSPFEFSPVSNPVSWTATAIGTIAASMQSRVILGNNSLRVPLSQAGVKYPGMYHDITAELSANSYQTATASRLQAAYQVAHPGATQAEALAATLDVAFGAISSSNDPEGLVTSPATHLRARSVELPDGWASLLTPEQCNAYNELAESMPSGD